MGKKKEEKASSQRNTSGSSSRHTPRLLMARAFLDVGVSETKASKLSPELPSSASNHSIAKSQSFANTKPSYYPAKCHIFSSSCPLGISLALSCDPFSKNSPFQRLTLSSQPNLTSCGSFVAYSNRKKSLAYFSFY